MLNTLTTSLIITTIGYIIDGDVKEPSMMMRFIEFFAMLGIVFCLISIFYFVYTLVQKRFQRV